MKANIYTLSRFFIVFSIPNWVESKHKPSDLNAGSQCCEVPKKGEG